MRWEQKVQYASISDIGFRRQNNQDSCVIQLCPDLEEWESKGHLFVVADGMGGHAVGELASKIAVDTIPHNFFKMKNVDRKTAVHDSITAANNAIHERGTLNRDFERMGTTCTALVLSPEGVHLGHVGDSRAYRIRGERIDQLTFDHSLQWELIRQGQMKPEEVMLKEPRHVITRSLGPEPLVEVDLEGPYPVQAGDTFVLCSDGLNGHVQDNEIGMIASSMPPKQACRAMVNLANLRGGSDNITIIIATVGEAPDGMPIQELRREPQPDNWVDLLWLTGFWGLALIVVAGIVLMLFGKHLLGALLTTISMGMMVIMMLRWHRFSHDEQVPLSQEDSTTVFWRPYQSASTTLDPGFLSHLAGLEARLQRAATDEAWQVDWKKHGASYQRAQNAINHKNYSDALSSYCDALDALMSGVQQHRRQLSRDAKWGKPPAEKSSH